MLTLNRVERRNALSVALRDTISDALEDLAEDSAVKVVVVTGAGKTFSAGFDLKEFDRAAADGNPCRVVVDLFGPISPQRVAASVAATSPQVNGPGRIAGGFDLGPVHVPDPYALPRPRRGSRIPNLVRAT